MSDRPSLEEILYDLVRLLPDDERVSIVRGASTRRRALAVASRFGVKPSPESVRSTALAFRRARELLRADDLSAWCADHGLSTEAFARLMVEEATLSALGGPDGAP